ncbi:WD40 repeat domain-containing protein [Dactylosporangium sp. NPDC051541]|uniref:WD40 repeat domain-containing protein n=1 Tax=Dactylosporangium sp. NPDC051541 TaxID=3363977 RepID=UPI00379FAA0A
MPWRRSTARIWAAPADDRFSADGRSTTPRRPRRTRAAGTVLRHPGHPRARTVTGCAIAPDGTWLVTTCSDGLARIFLPGNGKARTVLAGHTGPVLGCAIAPGGEWLATAGADGTARLWNPRGGPATTILDGHRGPVQACAVSTGGEWLAGVGRDARVRVWDVAGGSTRSVLTGHEAPVLGCAVARDSDLLATVSGDGVARIWSVPDGECLTMTRVDGPLRSCAWGPAGLLVLGGTGGTYVWQLR